MQAISQASPYDPEIEPLLPVQHGNFHGRTVRMQETSLSSKLYITAVSIIYATFSLSALGFKINCHYFPTLCTSTQEEFIFWGSVIAAVAGNLFILKLASDFYGNNFKKIVVEPTDGSIQNP